MLFIQARCPFCKRALRYIDQAREEHPELKSVEIEIHDELEEPAFADTFDYYYVPTFYADGEKLHEGGIEYDEVVELLRKVL